MLVENGFQESITSKIFQRITNNHNLSQSQQQTQATYTQEKDIKMSLKYCLLKILLKTTANSQISQNKIQFLH